MTTAWDKIEGNWERFRGMVQERWGELTNDELDQIKGNRTQLKGRLQAKYGIDADEADDQINSWLDELD